MKDIIELKIIEKEKTDFLNLEIVDIEKFNPYHGPDGRFTSASGATLFTIRTKDSSKQYLADRGIEREKKRTSGEANTEPTAPPNKKKTTANSKNQHGDPETIAGVKRGEPMTREQADQGNANPNFEKGGGYYRNCQSCVVCYEARLRGYDVTTKPKTPGSKLDELSRKSYEAWIDPATGKTPERPMPKENITTAKKCKAMLEETIKPGERYTMGHNWKGRSNVGHIICADRDSSGNLRLFDPQSGKTMIGKDVDAYLSQIKYTTSVYGSKFNISPRLLRVDNLYINPEYADYIMEANKS